MYQNLNTEANDNQDKTTVNLNAFYAGGSNFSHLYVIEVKGEDLDVQNGFKCLQITIDTIATSTCSILYVMHTPRFISEVPTHISAVID